MPGKRNMVPSRNMAIASVNAKTTDPYQIGQIQAAAELLGVLTNTLAPPGSISEVPAFQADLQAIVEHLSAEERIRFNIGYAAFFEGIKNYKPRYRY